MNTFIKKLLLSALLLYTIKANVNCAAAVIAFIPLIGATNWVNTANANNTFFFFDIKDNSNTSTFTGNEFVNGTRVAGFKGSFQDHNIQFVYDAGDPKKGTYSGTINEASTLITLTGTNNLPALTLKKP